MTKNVLTYVEVLQCDYSDIEYGVIDSLTPSDREYAYVHEITARKYPKQRLIKYLDSVLHEHIRFLPDDEVVELKLKGILL